MGLLEGVGWILTGLFFAGLISAVILGFVNLPAEEVNNVLSNQNVSIAEKGSDFLFMEVGLKAITPAYMIDWLPGGSDGTDYIYLLEDFPLPDEIDIIGFMVAFLIMFFLFSWDTGDDVGLLIFKVFLIILCIPLGYIIAKLFYYFIYYNSGTHLGISRTVLTAMRNTQINLYNNFIAPMMILAGTTFAFLMKKWISAVTD